MPISFIVYIFISINFLIPQSKYILEKELDYKVDFFTVDKLGHLYLIKNSELKKVDLENKHKKSYSNILSGRINTVDVSDPFRTLLFYKDFNKIELLDKNLSKIISPIILDDLGYYNVLSVCQSVNGGFWIFDQSLSQIVYIDKKLNSVKKSSQLSDLIDPNIESEQVFMIEKNDYIYLGIRGEGILLFDSYGTYIKTFPLLNISLFQVNNGVISYYHDGELYFYDTNNFEENHLNLPKLEYKQVMIENKKLFVQTEEKIFIYQLNNF